MASSGNFCTLNPLAQLGGSTDASTRAGGMSNGNLKYVNLSGNTSVGSFALTSGKWYYEVRIDSMNSDTGITIGFVNNLFNIDAELGEGTNPGQPTSPSGAQAFGWYAQTNNLIYGPGNGGSSFNKAWGGGSIVTDGDIISIYLDVDNLKFWAAKNGTVFNSGDPAAGTGHGFGTGGSPHNIAILPGEGLYPAISNWSIADATVTFNFGQDDTFGGGISAAGNADGNGFGVFKYAPPTGFLALCSGNLPISDDIDPAQTESDYSGKQFNTVLFTGDASTSNAVTGLGFQPDLVWIKARDDNNLYSNALFDSSRGRAKSVFSDSDRDENSSSSTQDLVSFDSDGFTVGTSYNTGSNLSGKATVAWCWKGAGGTTASNGSGSTTSTVQANTKSGFSIMTYTGTGSNATIGHGLSAKPDLIFTKRRSSSQTWGVYHSALGATKYLALNSNAAAGTDSAFWNDTEPTSTLIYLGTEGRVNASSQTYVAYAWHNVEGYSKFGSYEGNANNDGPFVYTGFRPRMLWIKEADNADDWVVYDTARSTSNPVQKVLRYESNVVEFDGSTRAIDILSNGFKIRTSNNTINQSSTFVYGCFGDVPFKYNNTF